MTTPEAQPISLQIGPYKAYSVPTGLFRLDGGAMFGTVPKVLWSKTNPTDEQNRILMECRTLLLISDDRKILIDTGNGSDFIAKYGEAAGSKFEQMYGVDQSGTSLLNSLKKHNVTPDQITDVILTHLHFDHAGGATCADPQGRIVPTFPNATYYIQQANVDTARKPNRRERASYLAPNFEPLFASDAVKVLDGPTEIAPHISVSLSNGHTLGQQNVLISDGKTSIFYCADLVPTSTHVKLAWVMGYDIQPILILEEKENILKQASKDNWYLFFEHDPYVEAAQISFNGKDFEIKERFKLK
ncbi:MAG: MBL fold metallo-hydrolase [Bdellovibrionaceae bacterium]|nr:MBL fold metallo-hydrolase [Pseudobdellovibrionaceae bacterium]